MGTDQPGTQACRQCRTALSGIAHLRLGAYMRGGTGLCLTCTDRLMEKHHCVTLHDFVPAYRRSQAVVSETATLRREVQELRALLEQLTQPDGGG